MRQARLGLEIPESAPSILFAVGPRIAKGMQMLYDVGYDWRSSIDTPRIDIQSGKDCITGQLEGDYMDFCSKNNIDPRDEAAELGFNALNSSEPLKTREFRALTRGWRLVVTRNLNIKRTRRLVIAA